MIIKRKVSVCVGVWLCPSHHCDDCGRTATMSCAFCPTAFCSEHHHNMMRLTEYYQLACLKHNDLVLCQDPNVLKIFGLCKTTKLSSSRKPPRRKSSGGVRRREDGEDVELSYKADAVSKTQTKKRRQKFSMLEFLPGERSNPARTCRERGAETKDMSSGDPCVQRRESKDDVKESRDSMKQRGKKRDRQRDKLQSKTAPRTTDSSEEDHSNPSLGSEGLKKGQKNSKASSSNLHQRKWDVDTNALKKARNSSDRSRDRSRQTDKQDVDVRAQKRRRLQDGRSTESLDFLSSSGASLSSPPLLTRSPGTERIDSQSEMRSVTDNAVMSAKSLVDERMFDDSDDDLPELVIDVPTI